ncbi:hypothetical protein [Agreia sp. VKM Ac-1783]|uniref:hypothetical protein n=1 Tax=Agreia sp. VKM Ac-1783 TaxID=1938889 RepID=UPI000A2ADF37|nr:hypothetical protein [Agreia sp. VKM Ac-1783]SMQ67794.1 hypothetical protein SAMN06295943_1272 [Agreia sp. VKM Ac-1783]
MEFLLIVLAIGLAIGLFFIVRSTVRYIRYSDASSDPDVGVNPQADYIFGRVGVQGTPAAADQRPTIVDAPFTDAAAPTIAPMEVGMVFGNPGGRHPVTRYDIPDGLHLTLPELLQGLRRDLVDGEEACSIVAAGKAGSSDARLDSAARVAALRDDVGALEAVLSESAGGDPDDAVLDQVWIYVVLNRIAVSWESYAAPRDVLAASVRQFEWLDAELSAWLTILDDETDDAALAAVWRQRLDDEVSRRATALAVRAD